MPIELEFTFPLPVTDRSQYINECCIGGDVVSGALLPSIRARYQDVGSGQEDWGWFIWFRLDTVRLAVDIFTDDPGAGAFRVHLTSTMKRRWFGQRVVDTPQLMDLRGLVVAELTRSGARGIVEARLDSKYM